MKKRVSVASILALVVVICIMMQMSVMAFPYDPDSGFFDHYGSNVTNDENDGFWFDSQDDITQAFPDGDSVRSGDFYQGYLRDASTPKHISGADGDGPFFKDEDIGNEEFNRYIRFNGSTYMIFDKAIRDAFRMDIDIRLEATVEGDAFAGFILGGDQDSNSPEYNTGTICVATTADSLKYASKIGLGIGIYAADDSKDQVIIYAVNNDGTVTASYEIDFADGTFNAWTKLTLIDDVAGTMKLYVADQFVATIKLTELKDNYFTKASILDKEGNEVAATTTAKVYFESNVSIANISTGDLAVDNWGIDPRDDYDMTLNDPIGDAPKPTKVPATAAPTEAPATSAPTQAPATDAPAEEKEEGGCGSSMAIAQVMLILGAAVVLKKRK